MDNAFIPSLAEPKDESRNPLQHFRGVLKEYKSETQKSSIEGRADRMVVTFNFTDVDVIKSTEPYPFPIATVVLPYSERGDTAWDVWRKSVVKLVPSRDINELVGKQQEWEYAACRLRRPLVDDDGNPVNDTNGRQKWGMQDSNGWQLISLEGASGAESGANLTQAIVQLCIGRTDAEFYQELMNNPDIKKMAGFHTAVEQASNRELLKNLEGSGLIKKNVEGKWEAA